MRMKWCLALTIVGMRVFGLWNNAQAQQTPSPEVLHYADMVLYNGKVLVADNQFSVAEAVAVRDGKILAVGTNQRILGMAGPKTQRFDLAGKTVTPGFIDTHFHMHTYAFANRDIYPTVHLNELKERNKQGLLEVIQKIGAQATPSGGWIIITDPRTEARGLVDRLMSQLTRQDLDPIFPQIPVAIVPSYGSNATTVLNSAGVKLVLPRLPPGTMGIVKDKEGNPTGQLEDEADVALREEILPWPDMEKYTALLQDAMQLYNSQGMTTINTRVPGYLLTGINLLRARKELTIRWSIDHELLGGPNAEGVLKRVGNISGLGDDMMKIVALMPGSTDSSGGNAGWTWEPRIRSMPGRSPNLSGDNPESLAWARHEGGWEKAYLAAKYGWSVLGVHSNGDHGQDLLLSAVEQGMKDRVVQGFQQWFAVDHALNISEKTPEGNQMERMKMLNVIPSLGPPFMLEGERPQSGVGGIVPEQLMYEFGEARVAKMLPAKTLIQKGLKPVAESDRWGPPYSRPLWNLEKFITRKDDEHGNVWGRDERVSREEALWMYTNWAAIYTGFEGLGTITPGNWADLVILGRDYMTVPEDEISEIPVVMTILGGKVVYKGQARF